ncbi:uncharacterized [Tachysurus ichikawai]
MARITSWLSAAAEVAHAHAAASDSRAQSALSAPVSPHHSISPTRLEKMTVIPELPSASFTSSRREKMD